MERRRERRIAADQVCQVTVLGSQPVSYDAKTIEHSGRGLRIRLAHALEPGVAVKVEMPDMLLLAEVCYSRGAGIEGEGYVAGLKIDQILSNLGDLTRLHIRLGFGTPGVGDRREDDCREDGQFVERRGAGG